MSGGESESRSRFPALSIFKRDYSPKLCRLFETPAKMQKIRHFETT
jgi:hypothetical protein